MRREDFICVCVCGEACEREARVALLLCGCGGECVMAREHSSLYASCERHEHPAERVQRSLFVVSMARCGKIRAEPSIPSKFDRLAITLHKEY